MPEGQLARKFSPYRPRAVGLSKNQVGVPQLLSQVGGLERRITNAPETTCAKQPEARITPLADKRDARPTGKGDTNKIVNKPLAQVKMVEVDAPPLSSDDEDWSQADTHKTDREPNDPILDSSDDERPSRGDIRKTTFKPSKKGNSPPQVSTRPKRQAAQATRTSARAKSSQGSQPSSSASRKLSDQEDPDELSEPLTNSRKRKSPDTSELGKHLEDDVFRQPPRAGAAYGKKGYGKKDRELIKVPPSHIKGKEESPEKANFIIPPKSHLKKEDGSPEKAKFQVPKDHLEKREDTLSPHKPLFIPKGRDSSPIKGSSDKKRLKQSLGQEKSKVESPEEHRKGVVIPEFYSDTFKEQEEVLKVEDELATIGTKDLYIIDSPKSSKPVCTMCDEEVDEEVRRKFDEKNPGSRFSLRREQLFCVYHKKKSARETWKLKGYPEINWKKLDKRIAKQHGFLQAILEGGQSYYGDIFNQSVKAGQNRTLLKSDQNMTPGYYGIRGLRAMTENLTYKFSRLLRERAVQDRLISSRGYMAYLQSVLVPELAVRLIKDDMSVDEERAREIMEESSAVGELLNEELKDVVLESEDEK